jgi:ferric-dicitrate binding protein FerR (iron transport regulator)
VIHRDPDEPFSAAERRALALWRAPEPPEDLAARVLDGLRPERGVAARGAAYAALAMVLAVGFFAVRLLSAGVVAPPGEVQTFAGDGGASAEVSVRDGVRS